MYFFATSIAHHYFTNVTFLFSPFSQDPNLVGPDPNVTNEKNTEPIFEEHPGFGSGFDYFLRSDLQPWF